MPQDGAREVPVAGKLPGHDRAAGARIERNKTPNASADARARHAQTWGLLFFRDVPIVLGNTPAMPLEEALFGGFFAPLVLNCAGAADTISPVAPRRKVAPPVRQNDLAVVVTREGLAR
ncbi:MAG: hypothetical protein J0M28_10425 [Thauera sp.]|nr:hypothetical protein [Thauera sp.]